MENKKKIVKVKKVSTKKNQELAVIETDAGKIDAIDQEKGRYTLVTDSPISSQQILRIFQRTPAEHIRTRPGKGGGSWEYVSGVYVKKILNYTFGWLWDFQIIDKGREGDQVWVQGRLTIKNPKTLQPFIIKEQFGAADIKFKKDSKLMLNYGNDLKSAATDALKKCASEIGIASDVYGKNEFKEISAKPTVERVQSTILPNECKGCGQPVSKQVADFSKQQYKKVLCAKCQKIEKL